MTLDPTLVISIMSASGAVLSAVFAWRSVDAARQQNYIAGLIAVLDHNIERKERYCQLFDEWQAHLEVLNDCTRQMVLHGMEMPEEIRAELAMHDLITCFRNIRLLADKCRPILDETIYAALARLHNEINEADTPEKIHTLFSLETFDGKKYHEIGAQIQCKIFEQDKKIMELEQKIQNIIPRGNLKQNDHSNLK